MYVGWHQVAFTRELTGDLTPVAVGCVPLFAVRTDAGVRLFDAVCPHRGANLGYGGVLEGDGQAVTCPFHGHRITLGQDSGSQFCVREYPSLELGGLLFVRLAERHENGLTAYLHRLTRTHCFVPGFALAAPISPEYVVENAFDADHFKAIHGINRRPELQLCPSEHGELAVESVFLTNRPNRWQEPAEADQTIRTRFFARAFSPTLIATELGEEARPSVVFTAATPAPDGGCLIRVSLALPLDDAGEPPGMEVIRALLRDSRTAFEQDMPVWQHLIRDAPVRYTPSDEAVVAYRRFCSAFLSEA